MPVPLTIALVCLVLVAAIYDLRFRRIPNWVSLSGIVLGLGCNTLLLGWPGVRGASLGLLCAVAVYVPLYLVRGMGAGDVKLMAAVGAIAGPEGWLQIFLATALIGGVVSLLVIASKHRFRQTLGNVGIIATDLLRFRAPAKTDSRLDFRHKDAIRLPHGAAIAGGSIAFLLLHASR
jgi:prepilin peptidase CpaA